jgi:GTP-binding protein HflX
LVFNKIDLYREKNYDPYVDEEARKEIEDGLKGNFRYLFGKDNIFMSAHTKEGLGDLREKLERMIRRQYAVRYPYRAAEWK